MILNIVIVNQLFWN